MLLFYSDFIKKGDLCFDIGANVGNRTEVFLKLGAKILAVEPQKECQKILADKFKDSESVVIIPKGLDKEICQKEIYMGSSSTLASMSTEWISSVKKSGRFDGHNWENKHTIETTTLDNLIKDYGSPVFCKIDVEGFEYDVIQGLSKPLSLISLEFTPEHIESTVNCILYLEKLGTAKFNYSTGESMVLVLPKWIPAAEMINVLRAIPKNIKTFGDIYISFANEQN
jgi:FkbM family methyltransferase